MCLQNIKNKNKFSPEGIPKTRNLSAAYGQRVMAKIRLPPNIIDFASNENSVFKLDELAIWWARLYFKSCVFDAHFSLARFVLECIAASKSLRNCYGEKDDEMRRWGSERRVWKEVEEKTSFSICCILCDFRLSFVSSRILIKHGFRDCQRQCIFCTFLQLSETELERKAERKKTKLER